MKPLFNTQSVVFIGLLLLQYLSPKTSAISSSPPAKPDAGDSNDIEDTDLVNQWIGTQNETNSSTPKDNLAMKSGLDNPNPNVEACECVKYYLCNPGDVVARNNTSPTSGFNVTIPGNATSENGDAGNSTGDIYGIVDIRQGLNTTNKSEVAVAGNGCPHYLDVCCKHVKNDTKPPPPEDPRKELALKDWHHTGCGHRNENGIGFKITGAKNGESQFAEFPWTVAVAEEELVEVDGPDGKHNATRNALLCGGSLIHPQVVLTAAHCVYEIANSGKRKHLKVRLGEWDTQTTDEPYPYQDRKVKEVVIHEQLYRKGLFNDVALLILDQEAKLAPNVDTLCLPPEDTQIQDFDGHTCFSSGWGKNNFGAEGRYQEIMKKTEVPIVPRKTCELELRKTKLGPNFVLHESFVCAGGQPGKDTCVGDGGAPLVCKSLNTPSYIQLGMVAWGIGCGTTVPAVYVNVPKLAPWIEDKMRKKHFDMKYCTL